MTFFNSHKNIFNYQIYTIQGVLVTNGEETYLIVNTPSDVADHDLYMRRASYESKNCNWNVFGSSSKPGSTNSGLIGQSIFKVYDTACITEGMK